MTDTLSTIVAHKRDLYAARKAQVALADVEAAAGAADAPRGFIKALQAAHEDGRYALIAECKKASPSKGLIRADFDPAALARAYAAGGAACLSVLTEERWFLGADEYLVAARAACALPVIRKDFIVDPYQVIEARAHGADAVLLIAECLDDCHLRSLYRDILDLGMTPLVELHDEENLPRVLDLGATLVGINNRNLKTMTTDLDHVLRLRARVPADVVLVAESGIKTRADVERLEAAGIGAMLVGESLLRQPDPGQAAARLLGDVI